jgi:hypothetical protein
MNRTRVIDPEVLGPRFYKGTRGTLDAPFEALPFSMEGAEDLPEEEPQHYACEYEESEAAAEPPYWATWGF